MSMEQTIAALGRMTAAQLRAKYLEVFGEPSRSGNRDFLFKRLAWRIQSLAEGTLSERARRPAGAAAPRPRPRPPLHAPRLPHPVPRGGHVVGASAAAGGGAGPRRRPPHHPPAAP